MKKVAIRVLGSLFGLSLLLVSFSAYSLSDEEKTEAKKWQEELAKRNKNVAKDCGIEIPTSISQSIVKDFVPKKRNATNFFCEEVLGAVRDLCKNPDSKTVILEKVKKIRCMKGKRAGKLGLRIKKETLFAAFTTETTDIQTKTRTWLQKKLKITGGLTVEQNNEWTKWQKSMSSRGQYLKKDCGADLKLVLDKNVAEPFVAANRNAYNPCFEALRGVQNLCKANELKDSFTGRIKTITCAYNKEPKEAKFRIDGDNLWISYGIETNSMDSKTRNWLDGEL